MRSFFIFGLRYHTIHAYQNAHRPITTGTPHTSQRWLNESFSTSISIYKKKLYALHISHYTHITHIAKCDYNISFNSESTPKKVRGRRV